MYKSPINLFIGNMYTEVVRQREDAIYRAVQEYDIDVDKEELVKALNYDRNQYKKGFDDAIETISNKLCNLLEQYPYKVIGKCETYSDYNQGWNDALNRACDEIDAIF